MTTHGKEAIPTYHFWPSPKQQDPKLDRPVFMEKKDKTTSVSPVPIQNIDPSLVQEREEPDASDNHPNKDSKPKTQRYSSIENQRSTHSHYPENEEDPNFAYLLASKELNEKPELISTPEKIESPADSKTSFGHQEKVYRSCTSVQSLSSTDSESSDKKKLVDAAVDMLEKDEAPRWDDRKESSSQPLDRGLKKAGFLEDREFETRGNTDAAKEQPSLVSPLSNCTDSDGDADAALEDRLRESLEALLFSKDEMNDEEVDCAFRNVDGILFKDKKLIPELIHKLLMEIYRCMTDFKDRSSVQIRACLLVGRIAQTCGKVRRAFGETEGVRHVLESLTTHKDCEVLQDKGIYTLLAVTPDKAARLQLTEQKGAECVCWAMREFPQRRDILMNGAMTLGNIAFGSSEGKKRVGKVGGIDAVVNAMYVHNEDSELLGQCCLALRNITFNNRANQWIAGRSCAMEAIVKCMALFPDDGNIQYQGLVALENSCMDETENRDRATEIGVIDTCILILTLHNEHPSLAEHGLSLLRNVCISNQENQLLIGNSGGIQLILTTMKYHRLNPKVLEAGCGAFRYLFFSKENRDGMYDMQGMEPLLNALREGAAVVPVCESALLALGNALFDNPKSKKLVARYGGIALVVDVLSKHLDSETIQEYGCRALRNLADSDELNTRLLGESGAIDTGIFAMMGYPQNAAIQEQACAMMFNMAFSDANIRLMKQLELARVVEHALTYHVQNFAVESQAKALLQRIKPMRSRSSSGRVNGKSGATTSKGKKSTVANAKRKQSTDQHRLERSKKSTYGN